MLHAGQMVLFARVVEAGSFAAAAKTLGQTRAAVSKQIGSLEERIGAQLLNRTTRTMHLTEIGAEFYARCARVAEETEEAERAVASLQGAPRGALRIAAPVTFGRRYLAPLVAPFVARHPDVTIDLCLRDAPTDIVEEGFDLAVRIAPRADAALVSRCLAESRHVVCGAPDYFARRGIPSAPEDLRSHNCLVYSSLPMPRLWRFQRGKSVRVKGSFAVNHGESLRQAVVDGLGLAYMPTFIVGRDLLEGRLVTALDAWVQSNQKVFAMYPHNRNLAPKVRVFVEFLTERFQPSPPWECASAPVEPASLVRA
ncbi:MAG: LysR family transcriptional regulator [Myxococcales bacterium]|nr:LysR family transcriptional regulator [Myxococcales bacterium]